MRYITRVGAFALAVTVLACGCNPNVSQSTDDPNSLGKHVNRGKEKRSLENDIGQLAKLIQVYATEFGKSPKTFEDLKGYIQRDAPHIVREIESGEIVVIYNAPSNSNTVLAYEQKPDLRGTHVVAMGDASVHTMTTAQLQTALQQQGVSP